MNSDSYGSLSQALHVTARLPYQNTIWHVLMTTDPS